MEVCTRANALACQYEKYTQHSEAAFDNQLNYRRELKDSFRYQNMMSYGKTQEKLSITLERHQVESDRQAQREQW
jgi:hypothetical protein